MTYDQNRENTKEYLKSIGNVYCPALDERISFNMKGFKHIIYPKGRHVRDEKSHLLRFNLIKPSKKLIELTTTLQEYSIE